MNINKKPANKKNYGGKRSTGKIKYLVYHYTANDGDSDEANGKYFANNIVKASAHYFVDDDSITQSVPDDYVAWSVGGKKYANTKGGTLHGQCTNTNSLSIELCDSVKNGKYDFTENTLKLAAELGRSLMKKYSIPASRVIRHYDVTGKICPKPFVENETAWKNFKERLGSTETGSSAQSPSETKSEKIKADGIWGTATTKASQKLLKTVADGIVSRQPLSNKKYFLSVNTSSWKFTSSYKGGSPMVKALQKLAGAKSDGYFGKSTATALQEFLVKNGYSVGSYGCNGYVGKDTVRAWQQYVNDHM